MIGVIRRRLAKERALPTVIRAAEARVKVRIFDHPPVARWTTSDQDPALGRTFHRKLAQMLGVPPEFIGPEDRLSDLLVVHRHELGEISDDVWRLTGFVDKVQPYAYSLMYLFEDGANRDAGKREWNRIEPRPETEEQWIDHLMTLTVNQFVTLAVAVRRPAA